MGKPIMEVPTSATTGMPQDLESLSKYGASKSLQPSFRIPANRIHRLAIWQQARGMCTRKQTDLKRSSAAKIRKWVPFISKVCEKTFAHGSQALANLKQIAHTGLSFLNVCVLRGLPCAAMMIESSGTQHPQPLHRVITCISAQGVIRPFCQ
jgi:hypothetical protein